MMEKDKMQHLEIVYFNEQKVHELISKCLISQKITMLQATANDVNQSQIFDRQILDKFSKTNFRQIFDYG